MKLHLIKPFTYVFFFFIICQAQAQRFDMNHRGDFPYKVSLGFNFIDDTFKNAEKFDGTSNLATLPYPSRISFETVLYQYLTGEAAFSYNKYTSGNVVNGHPIQDDWNYYSYDANLKFYFGDFIAESDFFEPYINSGLSYNVIHDVNRISFAIGGGINVWPFTNNYDYRLRNRALNNLGFYFQGQGKAEVQAPGGAEREKHLQFAFGAIFKFR
jgi:hypothetical protein